MNFAKQTLHKTKISLFLRVVYSLFFAYFSVSLASAATTAVTQPVASKSTVKDSLKNSSSEKNKTETRYRLQYKLDTGDVLRYKADHRMQMETTIDETTDRPIAQTKSLKAWKIVDVLPNGTIEFMHVIEHLSMTNQISGKAPTTYDSKKDRTPPPGFEDAARAVGVPLSVIEMSPSGKIIRRQIKVRQPAADKDAQITIRLPEKPVAVGESWNESLLLKVDLAGGSRLVKCRRHYELLSVTGMVAKIQMEFQALTPLTPRIKYHLIHHFQKGTIAFNITTGQITSVHFKADERVIGFAGPTSSMRYIMKLDEVLITDKEKTTTKNSAKTVNNQQ